MLAAGAPEQTAFMSDEAMESIPGLKPIQYTAKHYALYLDKMTEKTETLNKGETVTETWEQVYLHMLVLQPHGTSWKTWEIMAQFYRCGKNGK